jgi:hypothetical protein
MISGRFDDDTPKSKNISAEHSIDSLSVNPHTGPIDSEREGDKESEIKKVNLKLYDIDGCLYPGSKKESGQIDPHVEQWLFEKNKILLAYEEKQLRKETFDRVVVASGSSRQSYEDDKFNEGTNHNASFAPALPLMQSYLQTKTKAKVVLDGFLMADIYGGKAAGDSYAAILKSNYYEERQKHSRWIFETYKISLIYAHAHRIATLHPGAGCVIDFYDDREEDVLPVLHGFFNCFSDLLPRNVSLRLHSYSVLNPNPRVEFFNKIIQGTGEVDARYDWSVLYLSALGRLSSEKKNGRERSAQEEIKLPACRNIKTAEELQKYQKELFKLRDARKEMSLVFNKSKKELACVFTKEKFLSFRRNQISHIKEPASQVVEQSNYTTANDLVRAKALPEQFVFSEEAQDVSHSTKLEEIRYFPNLSHEISEFFKYPLSEAKESFYEAITALRTELANDIRGASADIQQVERKAKKNSHNVLTAKANYIQKSPAGKIAQHTAELLHFLGDNKKNKEEKLEKIHLYKKQCDTTPGAVKFLKAIGVVFFAAIGFVLGAALGAAVMGTAAGPTPGAFLTSAYGFFKGAFLGSQLGLTLGATVTGVGAASVAGHLLFKRTPVQHHVKAVVKAAEEYVQEKQSAPQLPSPRMASVSA